MTLRSRLTVWNTAILTGGLLFFGALVYLMLSFSLLRQVESSLQRTADDILRASQFQIGGIPISTIQLQLDLTANTFVQIFDEEGNLLQQTMNFPSIDRPFDPDTLASQVQTFSNVTIDGTRLRVLTVPIISGSDEEIVRYLQLSASLSTLDAARDQLLLTIAVGGLLTVAVAAYVSWMTTGAALRPLEQVTITALQITRADDLSRRIPPSSVEGDEVGRLISAFNETLERLENHFETQRRFLADVSHELRTPLTAIRGNVDLIRRMGEADKMSLDAVTAEVDRMTRMVRDLLLLAQAETGKLPLANDVVELDTLMLEVYHQAKVLASDGQQIHIGEEDQARIMGDRDRLKQVILNLVANAIEHTPPDGSITLGLACQGDIACMTVRDTGKGISSEELPHIFERFYRVDPARKRKDKSGAGLGLSIAYWITRNHEGRLEVESTLGEGTTFFLYLPLLSGRCDEENGKVTIRADDIKSPENT
jgi:two-component system, OmpR family, sensor kinase